MAKYNILEGEVVAQDQKLNKIKLHYKVVYENQGDIKKIVEDNIKNMTNLVGVKKIEHFDHIIKFRLQTEAGKKGLGVRVKEFYLKAQELEEAQENK